jgi:hypothetical protein
MFLVKVENSATDIVSAQGRKACQDARGLTAEPAEECKLPHIAKLQGGSHVGLCHRFVVILVALAGEQLDLVHLDGIVLGGTGSKDGEAPVETLGTAAAMGMQLRDVISPRAANGMLDQPAAATIDNRPDDFRFGFPNERILNLGRLADCRTEELTKTL